MRQVNIVMAILKHLAIKNANYNDAFDYLTLQHDEFSMRPILDENGNRIPRENYLIEGINCDPFTYAEECEATNASFGKNKAYNEIKAHHYIISFDPKDKDENGLTMERAQALGMKFAKKNFPGHQALVCTHPDGHSSSGNLHVHIVINSLRKETVERTPFMKRKSDNLAGFKHNLTKPYLSYLKQEVMNMCQENALYQVDLLSPATEKITDKEYWQSKRGQLSLDNENAKKKATGEPVTTTKYETNKALLRSIIKDAICDSKDMTDFEKILLSRHSIEIHYSREKIGFLLPGKTKVIRARQLGTFYEKESIEKQILAREKGSSPIRFVVDLENNIKARENAYYAQKVQVGNLTQMSKALIFVQENGIESLAELENLVASVNSDYDVTRAELKATEKRLKEVNERIHYTGQYLANKATYQKYLKAKSKSQFREENRAEIALFEAARKYLKEAYGGDTYPTLKALKSEKEKLVALKNTQYENFSTLRSRRKNLQAVYHNVTIALGDNPRVPGRKDKAI